MRTAQHEGPWKTALGQPGPCAGCCGPLDAFALVSPGVFGPQASNIPDEAMLGSSWTGESGR